MSEASAGSTTDVERAVSGINIPSQHPVFFWTLISAVLASAIPFGGVYEWTWAALACVVGVLMLIWTATALRAKSSVSFGFRRLWILIVPFLLVCVWTVVQVIPMPGGTWQHPIWTTTRDVLEAEVESTISINPEATLSDLTRLLTYGAIFWMSVQWCRVSSRARQVILAIIVFITTIVIYGLISYAVTPGMVLWFENPLYKDDLTGTFINRNSFATFVGLGFICLTAVILTSLSKKDSMLKRRKFPINVSNADPSIAVAPEVFLARQNKVKKTSLLAEMTVNDKLAIGAWCLFIVALVMSHSRAGFGSTLVGLLSLLAALALTRAGRLRFLGMIVVPGFAILSAFVLVAGKGLGQRFASDVLVWEQRPVLYSLTMQAIADSPALGTGYGTFEEVFRFYRTPDLTGYFAMAHSTYLENALELGIPAAVCLMIVFIGFLFLTARGVRLRRRDSMYPAIGFAATVLVSLHSFVDFSLQIPSIAAVYALIMGAAVAQCWSSRHPVDAW